MGEGRPAEVVGRRGFGREESADAAAGAGGSGDPAEEAERDGAGAAGVEAELERDAVIP